MWIKMWIKNAKVTKMYTSTHIEQPAEDAEVHKTYALLCLLLK